MARAHELLAKHFASLGLRADEDRCRSTVRGPACLIAAAGTSNRYTYVVTSLVARRLVGVHHQQSGADVRLSLSVQRG